MKGKWLTAILLAASFAGGVAAVIAIDRATPTAQAQGTVVPQEFDTEWMHCVYIHTAGPVVPGQLACVPKD